MSGQENEHRQQSGAECHSAGVSGAPGPYHSMQGVAVAVGAAGS